MLSLQSAVCVCVCEGGTEEEQRLNLKEGIKDFQILNVELI